VILPWPPTVDTTAGHLETRQLVLDDDEAVGGRIGKWLQQDAVHAGKHGAAGGDAERQREDGGGGESGAATQPPKGIPYLAPRVGGMMGKSENRTALPLFA